MQAHGDNPERSELGLLGHLPGALLGRVWPGERVGLGTRVCKALAVDIQRHLDHAEFDLKRSRLGKDALGNSQEELGLEKDLCAEQICTALLKFCGSTVAVRAAACTRSKVMENSSRHGMIPRDLKWRPVWKMDIVLSGIAKALPLGLEASLTVLDLQQVDEALNWNSRSGKVLLRQLCEVLRSCKRLHRLGLRGNRMGNHWAGLVLSALAGWKEGERQQTHEGTTTLTSLDLRLTGMHHYYPMPFYGMRVSLAQHQQLTELDVSRNKLGASGVMSLSRTFRSLQNLTTLNMYGTSISEPQTTAALIDAIRHCPLKTLDLGFNELKDDGSLALATALAGWKGLVSLSLSSTNMGTKAMTATTEALSACTALSVLDLLQLRKEQQDADVVLGIARGLVSKAQLRILNLSSCLDMRNPAIIGGGIRDPYYYDHDDHDDPGRVAVQRVIAQLNCCEAITHLSLNDNRFNDADAASLGEAVEHMPKLTLLSLASNSFSDSGVSALLRGSSGAAGLCSCARLQLLDMSGCTEIGTRAVGALAAALHCFAELQTLLLHSCELGPLGTEIAEALAEGLAGRTGLEQLDLRENNLGADVVAAILRAVKPLAQSGSLRTIDLRSNAIGYCPTPDNGKSCGGIQEEFCRGLAMRQRTIDDGPAPFLSIDAMPAKYSRPYGWVWGEPLGVSRPRPR